VSGVKGGCRFDTGDEAASVVMEAVEEEALGKTEGRTFRAIPDVVSVMTATGRFKGIQRYGEVVGWCYLLSLEDGQFENNSRVMAYVRL
jgi:hypothetical protein